MGFEPMCPFGQTVFKTASLWPLRYLSTYISYITDSLPATFNIITHHICFVKHFFQKISETTKKYSLNTFQCFCELIGAWCSPEATLYSLTSCYDIFNFHSLDKSSYSLGITHTSSVESDTFHNTVLNFKFYWAWAGIFCFIAMFQRKHSFFQKTDVNISWHRSYKSYYQSLV